MPEFLPDLIRASAQGLLPGGEQWVNVFHVLRTPGTGDPVTSLESSAIAAPIVGFYDAINGFLSSEWSLVDVIVKDQQDETGAAFDPTFTPLAGSSSDADLPNQVALVVSWLTALGGRRYRGRTYLAGFTEANSVQTAPFGAGIDATQRNTIGTAAAQMIEDLDTAGFPLVVWSRVGGTATPVNRARVGVTWDTQRRRRNKLGEAYAVFLPDPPLP
jgi:hypothetical protein